ncbi:MAG: malto-oligosyltrehalose synthase [Thermoplasmata archaeon]
MGAVRSLYRLQLTPEFPFASVEEVAPYLARLGVSHLYLSPVLEARRGSSHGYDGTDPTRLRAEFGGLRGWRRLVRTLRSHGLGAVVDIVPNHLAASPETPAWWSVLAEGTRSPFARFFDIDWAADPERRLVLPLLSKSAEEVVSGGGLALVVEPRGLVVALPSGLRLPLGRPSWRPVLRHLRASLGTGDLPSPASRTLDALDRLAANSPRSRGVASIPAGSGSARLTRALREWGGGTEGAARWRALLDAQPYRLIAGADAHRRVNYRRFFQVAELVGVRQEDRSVFEATHRALLGQVARGEVDGIRVDHVDGLRDPGRYLARLAREIRARGRPPSALPVWVEKILTGEEELPGRWPVAGTTGYEFLRRVNELFIDPAGFARLRGEWSRRAGTPGRPAAQVDRAKQEAIERFFLADLHRVARGFERPLHELLGGAPPPGTAERGLAAFLRALPVYRTYRYLPDSGADDRFLSRTAEKAFDRRARRPAGKVDAALREMLAPPGGDRGALPRGTARAVRRLQQFEPAVMAKGFEDCALYRYTPLTSMAEVGGALTLSADARGAFHEENERVARRWPWAMRTTSTHDTKRSEDVRARLNALSGIPNEYARFSTGQWRATAPLRFRPGGRAVPTPRTFDLLLQTLLGTWPPEPAQWRTYPRRVGDYLVKALREAGEESSWDAPDLVHEARLRAFVDSLLEGSEGADFRAAIEPLVARVARAGAANSLAQVALKLTSPGVPDVYQGCELWDFSLVDPDNRRPIDFRRRSAMLERFDPSEPLGAEAFERQFLEYEDGAVKLCLTARLLHLRKVEHALGAHGGYRRIPTPRRPDVVAYLRRHGRNRLLVVVGTAPFHPRTRQPIRLDLPASVRSEWVDVLTGETHRVRGGAGDFDGPLVFGRGPPVFVLSGSNAST